MERVTREKKLNLKDETGRIQVIVQLRAQGSGGSKKGNLMKSLTIKNQTVSEVFRSIERHLFGEDLP